MRSVLVIILLVLFPLPALAQGTQAEIVYAANSGDSRPATGSVNGWTYTARSGSAYANVSDPNFQAVSYDSQGRLLSYTVNGQEHYILYTDSASGQVKATVSAAAQQTVNTFNLLASQRAVDRSIFDRLFTTLVTNRLGGKGLSAGDDPAASLAAWVDGSLTLQGSSRAGSQNASNQYILLAGLDRTASERLTFGVSAGFNRNNTEYHVAKGGNQQDDYFLLNPYAGFNFWGNAFLGLQAGLKYGRTSLTGKTNTDYQSLTTSAGAFATYAFLWDRFLFNPMVGYTYSFRNAYADGVEGSALGLLKAGGRLTWQSEKVIPYLDLAYNYDTIGQAGGQRGDMLGTAGLDFIPSQRWRVSLFVSNTFFRDKEYCTTFDLNLRYCF
ncbi:autotransporter outer membrane beta-barrel domain-containing protein [Solidesulfovibrio sp.]|uniref:autotransporter outer membrane beta-barrel domain-containing protein n=1 Tax=Solidesulfovibrio sp. TaxID=2910990 RepID=UPI002B1F06F1|nr:autotransporter outer membrane beta-barrel domain-containing protein [Solidesulfovibrio sp.]MEA4857818.1 autotransporter outer membrane beta-barrel domain-containing protein [Solidesulfovibrio sp.]